MKSLTFLSGISVSIGACVHMYVCVCTYMCSSHGGQRSALRIALQKLCTFSSFEASLSLACGLLTRPDWLASELQRSSCFYCSSSGVTSTGHHHQPGLPLLLSHQSLWLEIVTLPKNWLLSSTVFLSSHSQAYAKG